MEGIMLQTRAFQTILRTRHGLRLCSIKRNELSCNSRYFCLKSLPVLTMYTKEECSLCDDARLVLENYKHRYKFEEVYITEKGNEEWFKKYRYEIPVFHLNGDFLMKHRVDEQLLEKTLTEHEEK